MKSVLLTRAPEDNLIIEKKLKGNFAIINLPLIKYKELELDLKSIARFKYIILTSKYAANIIATMGAREVFQMKKFFVVGENSRKILNKAGFPVSIQAANAEDLLKYLPQELYTESIYLSGNEITKQLPSPIFRYIIYNTEYTVDLSAKNLDEIKGNIDYILLYSQNCGKILIRLLEKYKLIKSIENSVVVAVSPKVAAITSGYCKNSIYCNKGQQKQLIDILLTDARRR